MVESFLLPFEQMAMDGCTLDGSPAAGGDAVEVADDADVRNHVWWRASTLLARRRSRGGL